LKSDEGIMLAINKKGELGTLWEMQDVENFDQTNEDNNEEGRKKTSPCTHNIRTKLCT
jgi:hypothetical protein